ncbi:MAG: ATP-binding protein [Clostridium sp.]
MEKNMHSIENVMSVSYNLFEKISNNTTPETWANDSLIVAKDIHEIKKEYHLIVRGIKEALEDKLNDNGINFEEIIKILKESMQREIALSKKNIRMSFNIKNNFFTTKHYFIMSVFRNLIMNAIEAIPCNDKIYYIYFIHSSDFKNHIFTIKDTGNGINEDNIPLIFSPGFSTKINYETGEINRGLGLSLVRDIVKDELNGSITVTSKENSGTTFLIKIPKNVLEEL